jgi:hypothetical protein
VYIRDVGCSLEREAVTVKKIGKQVHVLAGLTLMCVTGLALADGNAPAPVVVARAADGVWNCNEATPERARWLADKASQDGVYQRAGECYLVAGENHLANEAFLKASARTSGDTSRKLAANLNDLKAQARQMKQALQHR